MANGNGCIVVDREAWKHLSPEDRDYMIYDTLSSMNNRLKAVEQWAWMKITTQFFGAMIGGALVVLFAMKYGVKV
jgi:hypothetical protein